MKMLLSYCTEVEVVPFADLFRPLERFEVDQRQLGEAPKRVEVVSKAALFFR